MPRPTNEIITLELRRDFFQGGFTSEYNVRFSLDLSQEERSKFAADLIAALIPTNSFDGGELLDLKGRDAVNIIDNSIAAADRPRGEELLYVSGENLDEEFSEEDGGAPPKQQFQAAIHTRFSEFSGVKHIKHKCSLNQDGALPESFSLRRINEFPELRIDKFRFGIELFQNRTFVFFNFAPYVGQTLLIEFNAPQFFLRLSAERLKNKNSLPFERENLFNRLSSAIRTYSGINLLEDYRKRLSD